ncbi:MAG TPA: hypothetical protein VF934_05855 [Burkholderiales bacterium]
MNDAFREGQGIGSRLAGKTGGPCVVRAQELAQLTRFGRSSIARSMLCVLLAVVCGCEQPKTGRVPVPVLPDKIELRVVNVVNPRLPRMAQKQIGLLLSVARAGVKEHFDRDITFDQPREISIQEFFKLDRLSADRKKKIAESIYDFKAGTGNRYLMIKTFAQEMEQDKLDLDDAISFAAPYLEVTLTGHSYQAFADALVQTQLKRLNGWKEIRMADGNGIIDGSPFNELVFWEEFSQAGFPAEVILTNQLFASAEYAMNSVHSAIRGGITNGVTTANPDTLFKTSAIVSTYPIIGKDPGIKKLRGDEVYSDEDAARFAGLVLVHEIGHQLFHYDHPYAVNACVMDPPRLLKFREWENGLSASECRKANAKAMVRGAVNIPCSFC